MDKSVQHRSILALPVTVQQDTPKGTWVDATGSTIAAGVLPMGVTQDEAVAGEIVAVTVLGTASMNLNGIASGAVMQGDVVCMSASGLTIKSPNTLTANDGVRGIVLYDAAATGHAEVLVGQCNQHTGTGAAANPTAGASYKVGLVELTGDQPNRTHEGLTIINNMGDSSVDPSHSRNIYLDESNFDPVTGLCIVRVSQYSGAFSIGYADHNGVGQQLFIDKVVDKAELWVFVIAKYDDVQPWGWNADLISISKVY